MIQATPFPSYHTSPQSPYERPPKRFEHRTTTRTQTGSTRSPAELVRSWEAFDRLFEDAFAPASHAPSSDGQPRTASGHKAGSYYTGDTPSQSRSEFEPATPKGHRRYQPQQQEQYYTEQTPSQSEFEPLYDDGASEMTETAIPGSYPKSYPLPETPRMEQYNEGPEPYSSIEANEDFQKLWDEAAANKRKRMTRTVTRKRILQHGMMSPTGSASTLQTFQAEPEKTLRRKKSRFHLYRNGDADMMTATFDLPDVRKEDVHVAFQTTQLTITWESTLVTERREPDRTIVRERKERKYARTLPIPSGTQFADIKAYLENGLLTVMYPKFPVDYRRAPLTIGQ